MNGHTCENDHKTKIKRRITVTLSIRPCENEEMGDKRQDDWEIQLWGPLV